MNPNKTPLLWKAADLGLRRLSNEERLRAEVTPVLDELAALFEGVQEVAKSADPLMLMKIWALSNIGSEPISVAGFLPREFVHLNHSIMLRVAPSHDMAVFDGAPISTRVVKFEPDPYDDDSTSTNGIEIYGLNMYVPNTDEAMQELDACSAKLLVVNQKGEASVSKKPVNGITPVLAVRNRNSGVAKVYLVDVTNDQPAEFLSDAMQRVVRTENSLIIATPDGRYVRIELLVGEKLEEILDELSKAISAIKDSDVLNTLSENERIAVMSHLSGRHEL